MAENNLPSQIFEMVVQDGATGENSTVTLHSADQDTHDEVGVDICTDNFFSTLQIPQIKTEDVDNILSQIFPGGEESSVQQPLSVLSEVEIENVLTPGISNSENQAEYHVASTSESGRSSSISYSSLQDLDYYSNMTPLSSDSENSMPLPEARMTQSQENTANQFTSSEPQMVVKTDMEAIQDNLISMTLSQDNTVNQFPSSQPMYELQLPAYPGIDPQVILVSPVPSNSNASPASVSGPDPAASPALDNSMPTLLPAPRSPEEQEQKMVLNIQELALNGVDPRLVTTMPHPIYNVPVAFGANQQYNGGYRAYWSDGQIHQQPDHIFNNINLHNLQVSFTDDQRQLIMSGAQQFPQYYDSRIYDQQAQQDREMTTWKKKIARCKERCEVCGDKSTGYHYNAKTCEGCKGFFKRTITNEKTYPPCRKSNNCTILMENRVRIGCKECRMKKCLRMGMDPTKVQGSKEAKMAELVEQETIHANLNSASSSA